MDFLRTDSLVEVRSEQEGFEGAWFVAKVLTKFSNQRDTILVEYQADSDQQYTEYVHISSIRPLPPPPAADQSYDPLDVVDAFHCDGWWTGVVSKVEVLEDKNTVVFENPPRQFDFRSRDLRFHLVWTDGKWVSPPKPKRMEGLKIGKGMDVEVNFDRETLRDAWFPAVVLEEVGYNSFLVMYSRSSTDGKDDHMESTVDSFHIRPPPPKLEVQNFEISACVEAFHDSCWKKGTIVKSLTQGRYNVLLDSEKGEIEFSQKKIRPHLLWIDGQWETPNGTQFEEQSPDDESSSTVEDLGTEIISCKRTSSAIDHDEENSSFKNPLDIQNKRENQNGFEGTASEMDFENYKCKETELSTVTNMANRGEKAENADNFTQSCKNIVSIVQADNRIVNKQEMPFTKSSPFWQHIDSQNIFQFLPQKPHFRPLFECNELRREGLAIGHMVSFITLVENIPKLPAKEPKQVLERYLEALRSLETLGFDVKPVVDRINKLYSIKTMQEQINSQTKDIHSKIAQSECEKAKIEEEIHAKEKALSELKTKLAMKRSETELKDSEINRLQIDTERLNEEISNRKRDFDRQAAAPW